MSSPSVSNNTLEKVRELLESPQNEDNQQPSLDYRPLKEDSDYLKYLYLIRDGKTLNDNISYDTLNKELEVTDIINTYENIGLLNTLKIVDECNLEFPKPSLLLPIYECPKGVDSSIYLMSLAKAGLSKRLNSNVTKDYLDRLGY